MTGAVPQVSLGMEQSGQEVRIAPGDTIVLRLPENPTTGVRWSFEKLDPPLTLTSDRYEQSPSNAPGAAATRVLTIDVDARARGRSEVKLRRWQDWEGASSIDAVWSCTVRIE